jgi:hypothetical protein
MVKKSTPCSVRKRPAACNLCPWLIGTVYLACRLTERGMLRYPSGTSPGLFRDAANVAMLALMYADLPAVTPQRQKWARCMARQTINYILGDNPTEWAYMVGFGCAVSHSCTKHAVENAEFTRPITYIHGLHTLE